MKPNGQAAVATDGASGLGAETARALAAAGARVAILDGNAELGKRVAAEIGALAVECDVASPAAAMAALAAARDAHGPARILVNCAGIGGASRIPFPKRLGRADEYARLVLHMLDNLSLNGEIVRLDGALRLAPR